MDENKAFKGFPMSEAKVFKKSVEIDALLARSDLSHVECMGALVKSMENIVNYVGLMMDITEKPIDDQVEVVKGVIHKMFGDEDGE